MSLSLWFPYRRSEAPYPELLLRLPQKNGQHNFALSLQTMAQHLLQEMQAAEVNVSKMFETPQSKQKQDPPEDTPVKGRTRATVCLGLYSYRMAWLQTATMRALKMKPWSSTRMSATVTPMTVFPWKPR